MTTCHRIRLIFKDSKNCNRLPEAGNHINIGEEMTITINGKETSLQQQGVRTVETLLEELDVAQRGYVTVELNGEILERDSFVSTPVKGGDVIEFLYFMGGGSR